MTKPLLRALELQDFVEDLTKRGAKHSAKDMAYVQKAHDAMAEMVDGTHCKVKADVVDGDNAGKAAKSLAARIRAKLGKRGARHSKMTLDEVKGIHDKLCAMGASCPDEFMGQTNAKDGGEG